MSKKDKEKTKRVPEEDVAIISPSFWQEFSNSEAGKDIIKAVISIVKDNAKRDVWHKTIMICIIIISASTLAYFDKFNPSMAFMFGSLLGFIYGKNE